MSLLRACAFLALFVLIPTLPASATITQVIGGPGGSAFQMECPPSQAAVGVHAKAGAWVDGVGLLCKPAIGDVSRIGWAGGSGGAPQEVYCPTDQRVTGIFLTFTRGNDLPRQFVNTIGLVCGTDAQPISSATCILSGDSVDGLILQKCSWRQGGGGLLSTLNVAADDLPCPTGEVLTGLHGRYGDYVDALGAICGPRPQAKIILPVIPATQQPTKVTGNAIDRDVPIAQAGVITATPATGTGYIPPDPIKPDKRQLPASAGSVGATSLPLPVILPSSPAVPVGATGTGRWWQTPASDADDVAVGPDGRIWIAGENGSIWFSTDRGRNFTKTEAEGFRRLSVAPDGVVWAVGRNGSLWRYDGHWRQTEASQIGDVSVGSNGRIWLAGNNATVWYSDDAGSTFERVESASGFRRVAAAPDGTLWAVGFNGTLWSYQGDRWRQTDASQMADVAVGPDGTVWLVGNNQTVWKLVGSQFTRIEDASGFEDIAAGASGVWAVGTNGTLWSFGG